jgi:poly-gamma-glutamate synthesis protein (capsule biosynthesis protein)
VTYQDIGNERVGILALNTIGTTVDDITLGALLAKMSFYSDLQIVYVHWGEEYKDISTKTQRSLAHTLIDNGVDVIIGDHPHVVEDIELYKGKPIFYSLGNFVFDQYFSDAVQQGLAVKMTIFRDSVRYDFMGVSSLGSKSQPHVMTVPEKQQFLQAVARKSDTALDTEIAGGHIVVSR